MIIQIIIMIITNSLACFTVVVLSGITLSSLLDCLNKLTDIKPEFNSSNLYIYIYLFYCMDK